MKVRKANFKSFLKSDRAILIICIGIALVFWLLVKLSHSFDATHICRINYDLPPDKTFVQPPPKTIRAKLNGRGWDLLSYYFRQQHSEISIELADLTNQTISANQLKDRIRAGVSSIEVLELDYDFINVELEEVAVRKVPVRIDENIDFATGFQMKRTPQLRPDSVRISGPQSLVSTVNEWSTEQLELTGLSTNFQGTLNLDIPSGYKTIKLEPTVVEVLIEVEEFTERTLFIPVTVKNAPDSVKIFPEKIKLSFVVGLSQYNRINSNQFVLEADLKGVPLNTGNNTLAIKLVQAPGFVRNIHFSPQSVEFFLVKQEVPEQAKGQILPPDD